MVSVTNTQNAIALQLLQNRNQASHNVETLDAKTGVARIRPSAVNDTVNRAMAQLSRFIMDIEGGKVAGRNIWTSSHIAGVRSTDNVGKGGETIIRNDGGKFSGSKGNDTIMVGTQNSVVHGGGGNDYIRASGEIYGDQGNDKIEGSGNLYGDDGNDTIKVRGNGSTAYGGAGNDVITLQQADGSTAHGGAGNDKISVQFSAGATVEGGKGDDRITVFTMDHKRADGATVVRFNVGDGKDFIKATHSDIVLELGEGFTAENTKVSYSEDGETAIVTFDGNEDDQLTIKRRDWGDDSASTFTLKFADGSTREIDELKAMYST